MIQEIFLITIITGIVSGLNASVYRGILSYEPILNWWFMIGQRYEARAFYAIIWGCAKCIAGQIALWSSIAIWIFKGYPLSWIPILIFATITAVSVAILTAVFIMNLLNKFN